MLKTLTRIANGARKVSVGLTPFGESVWPGVKNDLFIAHCSIYRFFSKFTLGAQVLDAGCGTGYGSSYLVGDGASQVVGVDIDARSIRYARRRFGSDFLRFVVGDCQELDLTSNRFDVVVSSNMLEHLPNPSAFLTCIVDLLKPNGTVLIALPPILSDRDLEQHAGIHYHRTNLSVDGWINLFQDYGWEVSLFRHSYKGPHTIDFSSPHRSQINQRDFSFHTTTRDVLYETPSITVIYVLKPNRGVSAARVR